METAAIPEKRPVSYDSSFPGLQTAKQQRVAASLMELFARSSMPDGQLPGERELAGRLGVSRRTLRTVLRWFEQRGHVRTVPFHGRQAHANRPRSTLADTVCLLGDIPADAIPSIVRADGHFHTVQYAAAAKLRETDYHTLILQLDRMSPERVERLIADRPAGVVLFQHFASMPATRALAEKFRAAHIPFVVHSDDTSLKGFDYVCSDHDDGAYRLTNYMIGRGCRRILRCWLVPTDIPLDAPWLTAKTRASERALREAGVEVLPLIEARCGMSEPNLPPKASFEHGVRVAAGYLMDYLQQGKTIDAIMGPSDYEAMCMASACRKFGLTPGKDILISGYDNCWADVPARAFEPVPPAATMDKKNAEIGAELIHLLTERINGTLPLEPQGRVILPNLVVPAG
jgi:DNA-binding LacI/PurR family transcriptional regulator